jgi:hypothetical protein
MTGFCDLELESIPASASGSMRSFDVHGSEPWEKSVAEIAIKASRKANFRFFIWRILDLLQRYKFSGVNHRADKLVIKIVNVEPTPFKNQPEKVLGLMQPAPNRPDRLF